MTSTPTYLVPVRPPIISGMRDEWQCPLCGRWATLDPHEPGTLCWHPGKARGCPASGMAVTLEAAIARDGRLNPQEKAAYSITWRYLHAACRGPLVDEECHHPICRQRAKQGLRWTLMGWQKR